MPGTTIRVMPGDREPLPSRVSVAGAGPAALVAELLGRVRAELPVISKLEERDQNPESAGPAGVMRMDAAGRQLSPFIVNFAAGGRSTRGLACT